jgi:hypothetical protein
MASQQSRRSPPRLILQTEISVEQTREEASKKRDRIILEFTTRRKRLHRQSIPLLDELIYT